jgi:hypothetical protein
VWSKGEDVGIGRERRSSHDEKLRTMLIEYAWWKRKSDGMVACCIGIQS